MLCVFLSVAASVCRVQAMKACKNGRLGMAMSWCIRSNDSAFAAYLAEKYVQFCRKCNCLLVFVVDIWKITRLKESSWTLTF